MGLFNRIKSLFSRRKTGFEGYMERVDQKASEKLGKDAKEFMEEASLEEKMSLLAEETKQDYGLDYSPESLKELDRKFDELEEEHPDAETINPSSKEELDKIMKERPEDFEYSRKLGILQNQALSYLGEVIKEEFGGEWMEKDFSDAFKRAGKMNVQGGLAGLSVPVDEESFHFVNIPNLVSKRVRGEITLYEAYQSIDDTVSGKDTLRNRKIYDKDTFDITDMREKADDIAEGLKLDYSSGGLEKLDKVLTVIDYESDVDDIDAFVLEVGCFLGVVLEENLNVDVKTLNEEFVVHVLGTDLKMRLMEAADNCVKKQEKSLFETYKFFEEQTE